MLEKYSPRLWDALDEYEAHFGFEYIVNKSDGQSDDDIADEVLNRIANNNPAPKPEPLPDDAVL